jgi:hypothetical protein
MGWIDVPSENIPATYAFMYQTLGVMLLQSSRPEAMRLLAQADSMVANTSYGRPRAGVPAQ